MPCPGVGPCGSWPLDLSCCLVSGGFPDPCLGDGTPVPTEITDQMKLAASQFMWAVTGRQFGCCTVTIRPCRKKCDDSCCIPSNMGFPWTPAHLADGSWTNIACGCQDGCSCSNLCSIDLPSPVCSVDAVFIDGVLVDPSIYRVDDFKKLVHLGLCECLTNSKYVYGPAMGLNTANGGTFTITFTEGTTSPIAWNASTGVIQVMLDAVLGGGNSIVTSFIEGQPLNAGFLIELAGIYEGLDVPGFIVSTDASLVTGPNTPYIYPFIQSNEGGLTTIESCPEACWPDCNNLSLPDTEVGTWSVTLTYGKPIPELVKLAASEFACQLIKKCVGRPCDLPQRIQSISRQGMNATFLDPMEFMKEGMTGIFLVDLAIKTYNPRKLYRKPAVVSPDSLNKWSVATWQNGDPIGSCTSAITEFSLLAENGDPLITENSDNIISEDG